MDQRPRTEEGIEPNPGPRYITKNVNGLQGGTRLRDCLLAISNENQREPITAVFIQEHNLHESAAAAHQNAARAKKLLLIIAYAPQKPGQQVAWGDLLRNNGRRMHPFLAFER